MADNGVFSDVDWDDVATGVAGISELLATWTGDDDDDGTAATTTIVVESTPISEQEWFWPVVLGAGALAMLSILRR